jgi:hypothetical protein
LSDVLIRDVPDEVVSALDAKANELGLSRNEFLRRRLLQESRSGARQVTIDHLRGFAQRCADLTDPEVMGQAWS